MRRPHPPKSFKVISLPTADVVVDKTAPAIYASVPSHAGAGGNSPTPVNPSDGTQGAPVFVGSEPGPLAVSDDGNYIAAEMVKAFLTSLEYQQRFGPADFDLSK